MAIARLLLILSTASVFACASGSRAVGPTVAVYEAEGSAPPAARRMPEGCRLLATAGPLDQMESERATNDPYRLQAAASPALAPPELKAKVLDMMRAGVTSEVLLAYVKGQRLAPRMTAEEIIDWTKAGIPDAVIEATASR